MKNLLILLVLLPISLFGQQPTNIADSIAEKTLEELLNLQLNVEVASTKGDKIFSSPSTVTVISKNEIQKFGFQNIVDVIQSIAGFSVERTYLKRNLSTGRGVLQDHYANKVLILINGVSTWNAVTGEGSLDRINIEDVEKIEVLKGPASVVYGTNAFSGAINIVLKKSEKTTAASQLGIGTNGSYEAGGSVNLSMNQVKGFMSLHTSNNAGPKKSFTDEANVTGKLNDFMKSTNANLLFTFRSHSVLGNVFQSDESYYGVTPKFASGAGNPHTAKGLLLNYTFNHMYGSKLNLKAGASFDQGSRNLSRTAADDIRASVEGKRISGFLRSNLYLGNNYMLELGADVEKRFSREYRNYVVSTDSTLSDNGMSDKSLLEYSAIGQFQANYEKFTFFIGGRFTHNEFFGNNFSPRLTGVYQLNEKNSLKIIYGKSYRTPSLFEYYFYSTSTVFGNTNLHPETAQSLELTYLSSFNNFFLQATLYTAKYMDKIVRTKDTTIVLSDGKTLVNYPKATVYSNGQTFSANGIEIELKYANPQIVSGFLNIDYTLGDKGDLLPTTIVRVNDTIHADIYNFFFVPKLNVSLGLNREIIKGLNLAVTANMIGSRGAIKPTVPSQMWVDFSLQYTHSLGKISLTHMLTGRNLTDNAYLIPEYSRLAQVNTIPFGLYRYFGYLLRVNL